MTRVPLAHAPSRGLARWLMGLALMLLLAGCRGKSVRMLRREGEIFIRPDGRVEVVETWEVRFRGGPFQRAYRSIPFRRLEAVQDWRVEEDGRAYRGVDDEAQAEPYTFWVAEDVWESRVVWYFPPTRDATRTFTLRYTLHGALWIADEGDRFFYTFVEADRAYPIDEARAIVHLPQAFTPAVLTTATFRDAEASDDAVTFPSPGTVVFQTHDLAPGEAWEIGVRWPHAAVQATPPPWQREEMRAVIPLAYDARLRLAPDGRVHVRETWHLDFRHDVFTQFTRTWPRHHWDRLADWQLSLDGQPCPWVDLPPAEGCGFTVTADDDAYAMTWYFPATEDASRTFTLTYTVWGAVAQGDVAQLRLPLVDDPLLAWPAQGVTVDLTLPAEVRDEAQVTLQVDGQPVPSQGQQPGATWQFAGPFDAQPSHLALAVEASWPGAALALPTPQWQQAQQAEMAAYRQRLQRAMLLAGPWMLLMALGVVALLVLEPPLWPWPWPRARPPEPVPPALAGVLLDRRVLQRHVLATLWDLARRGHLRLEYRPAATRGGSYRWRRLTANRDPLRLYERRVLEALFPSEQARTCAASTARDRLNHGWGDIVAALQREVEQQGWFHGSVQGWAWLPRWLNRLLPVWAVLFVGGCLLLDAPATAQQVYSLWYALFLAMLAAWWWVPRRLPPRTWRGWWAAARWRAYRWGLRVLGRGRARSSALDLAYATAFGLGPRWWQRAADDATAAAWSWVRVSTPGPAPEADASEATPAPTLNTAASQVFATLQAVAEEIFSALNAATAPETVSARSRRASSSASRSGFGRGSSRGRSFTGGRSSGGGSSGFE